MKRNLITQMRNECSDNIWLIICLMILTIAIWWLLEGFCVDFYGIFFNKGYNIDNVYRLTVNTYPSSSPFYVDRREDERNYSESHDLHMLIEGIRKSEYVEAAALSLNGLPQSSIYFFGNIKKDKSTDDSRIYKANIRFASPEMVRVLKLKSRTGKSEKELENYLREGGSLISNVFLPSPDNLTPEELNGETAVLNDRRIKVMDIIDVMRRNNYEVMTGDGAVLLPIDENSNFYNQSYRGNDEDHPFTNYEVAIRIRPGMENKFYQQFDNDSTLQRHGNFYLSNFICLKEVSTFQQKEKITEFRKNFGLIVCLLIMSSLGILGIFWFRTQQRASEIALRKVCGAKSSDIFTRYLSEGIILLIIASLLAAPIGWYLFRPIISRITYMSYLLVFILELITFAIEALTIIVSLWWPAYRAMKIEPAEAIKEE